MLISQAEELPKKRGSGRSGGRRGKQASVSAENAHLHTPFITRKIPFYEIATDEQLIKIVKQGK